MKTKEVIHELKHHSPFTLLATLVAIIISLFFYKTKIPESIFEILHSLHVFASAIVTSAIFYKYKKNTFQATLVGISGAIIIGSLSDIIFPYLGMLIFQIKIHFHLPIIEEPIKIILITLVGAITGITTKLTKFPHIIHVAISVFASLFYILTFSTEITFITLILSFLIIFVAVIIPCCISDILFPFFFLKEKIKKCDC